MPIGKLMKLVHLSQQTHVPGTRLVPDRNDKGYGIIEDAGGQGVYFGHDAVAGLHGFDNLRLDQAVEYTLDTAPYLRATSVRTATAAPANMLRPAA